MTETIASISFGAHAYFSKHHFHISQWCLIFQNIKCPFFMRMMDSTRLHYSKHYITINCDFSTAQMNRYIVLWSTSQREWNCLILHLNCLNTWIHCRSWLPQAWRCFDATLICLGTVGWYKTPRLLPCPAHELVILTMQYRLLHHCLLQIQI